jgi:hypothetical protein
MSGTVRLGEHVTAAQLTAKVTDAEAPSVFEIVTVIVPPSQEESIVQVV